jgi:hypothetical protein
MEPEPIPIELSELEARLKSWARGKPSFNHRENALRAVAGELASRDPRIANGDRFDWRWAAIAASGFIVLALSMIGASQTEFRARPLSGGQGLADELRLLHRLEANDGNQPYELRTVLG